ncbi:MAG: flagellin [Bacteriovoracia bacterium]
MGFRIATNTQSLSAQRQIYNQRMEQGHKLEVLAAGERITRAADDAAGLAISEKLRGEIRSIRQASRNAQDAVSLVQVAEGGLNEVSSMLIRMRELSIQGASDTIGDSERGFINKEVQNLKAEIQRIADSTHFNNVNLLNGENPELEFQVGTGASPEKDRVKYEADNASATIEALGIEDVKTETKEDAQNNISMIDSAINSVSSNRATFGALQNRLQSTITSLMIGDENISAANSRIRDADMALETSELTKRNILANSSTAALSQANQNNLLALKLIG